MSLITRLVAPQEDEDRIPIHSFSAAIGEFQRGAVTAAQIGVAFELSAAEMSSLTQWYSAEIASGNIDRVMLHDVLLLGETQHYSLAQVRARLNI